MRLHIPACMRRRPRGRALQAPSAPTGLSGLGEGSTFDKALQLLATAWVAELAQGFRFDLANALASHLEILPDLFQRVVALFSDAKAHSEDLLLARRERLENLPSLFREVHVDHRFRGGNDALVLDEIAEMRIFLLADWGLEADGLLGDLEDLADLVEWKLHLLRDLFRRRLTAVFLHEVPARADELVDGLDHVHRNADGAGLIGDGARDGLPDPPRRVRRELVAALVLELVDGLHQADVPLLDEVEELQATVRVLFGDADDEPQVGLDQLALGAVGDALALADVLVGPA